MCVCACVRLCVHACVHASECVCVFIGMWLSATNIRTDSSYQSV